MKEFTGIKFSGVFEGEKLVDINIEVENLTPLKAFTLISSIENNIEQIKENYLHVLMDFED